MPIESPTAYFSHAQNPLLTCPGLKARSPKPISREPGELASFAPNWIGVTMPMKKLYVFLTLPLFIVTFCIGTASATTGSATMAVTVTVASSISLILQTDASGLTLTNSGTSAVTAAFGTMSAYGGTVPTGVTRTVNAPTNWKISTPFDPVVQVANQTSATYTLTAQLQTADSTNTWAMRLDLARPQAASHSVTAAHQSEPQACRQQAASPRQPSALQPWLSVRARSPPRMPETLRTPPAHRRRSSKASRKRPRSHCRRRRIRRRLATRSL